MNFGDVLEWKDKNVVKLFDCSPCNFRRCKSTDMHKPGQPTRGKKTSWYHKGHDGKIITRVFFYLSREYPNGYMVVGNFLFLQARINKRHHHHHGVRRGIPLPNKWHRPFTERFLLSSFRPRTCLKDSRLPIKGFPSWVLSLGSLVRSATGSPTPPRLDNWPQITNHGLGSDRIQKAGERGSLLEMSALVLRGVTKLLAARHSWGEDHLSWQWVLLRRKSGFPGRPKERNNSLW